MTKEMQYLEILRAMRLPVHMEVTVSRFVKEALEASGGDIGMARSMISEMPLTQFSLEEQVIYALVGVFLTNIELLG